MANFSKTSLSPVKDGTQYGDISNNTWPSTSSSDVSVLDFNNIIMLFYPIFCTFGLLGNGTVIYLLGLRIKRSPFMTCILNLAIADFGVLLFFGLILIVSAGGAKKILYVIAFLAGTTMHNASQLLLTAISIDRCVSVLFPIWHRCHRPPYLSTMVCALIWLLSCLTSGSATTTLYVEHPWDSYVLYPLITGPVLCLPVVTISTLILLFKGFCKAQQPQRGRLFTIVFLTLLFFLIFASPLNIILTLVFFTSLETESLLFYGIFCANMNSSVNPLLYYMVGKRKRSQERQSLKTILQRAFEEEEERREERGTAAQTSL
ncbi:mas-related G-protein coupled receptor member H-like [Paroedura picta]|uniref:mas-related G-protein coupled receptor member H-like n=1 Tax=Paroedura picta TaxID=143630 RepID=UPI0040569164